MHSVLMCVGAVAMGKQVPADWAAQYNTQFLIILTPKGAVFSVLAADLTVRN